MLLCNGPASVDIAFQSSSASPANLRNSLTDPGPNPAKWLLKKMNPCLKRFDFSSSVGLVFLCAAEVGDGSVSYHSEIGYVGGCFRRCGCVLVLGPGQRYVLAFE